MAYATTALVKTYLGVTSVADDALIGTLIVRAQAMIDKHTARTFEAASDATRYFDSVMDVDAPINRRGYLVRNSYGTTLYFTEGLELAQAPTTVTNGDSVVLVLNTDFVTEPANIAPFFGLAMMTSSSYVWTQAGSGASQRAISVLGRWAYSITAPDDVVAATIRLVAFMYRQRESSVDFDRAVSVGDGMVLHPGRIPTDIATILAPYKRFT